MNRTHVVRILRIAFSIACGIACVLLIVLWVRSYWWIDEATIPIAKTQSLVLIFIQGGVRIVDRYNLANADTWEWDSIALERLKSAAFVPRKVWEGHRIDWGDTSRMGFNEAYILAPYWLLITGVAAFAAVPWIPWRFSLRTLLIATTLVAVALGLIVYLSAKPPASPPIDHVDVPEF